MSKIFKILTAIYILSTITDVAGQQHDENNLSLVWENSYVEERDGELKYFMYFKGAKYEGYSNLPYIEITVASRITDIVLSNLVFESIEDSNSIYLPKNLIADTFSLRLIPTTLNKKPATVVSLLPIRFNRLNNKYERLLSFSYKYKKNEINSIKPSFARTTANKTSTSVLSTGEWFKLAIPSSDNGTGSGVYKMDYSFLANLFGPILDQINPSQFKLFGNGGGMLPESNAEFRIDDLQENAIWISGEADGKFDKEDYILFYGKGPDIVVYDSTLQSFKHVKNTYSNYSCYFITISGDNGKRVQMEENISEMPTTEVTQFTEYLYHEADLENLLNSGKEWYGESFKDGTTHKYSFNMDGYIPGSQIVLTYSVMASSSQPSELLLSDNNKTLSEVKLASYSLSEGYGEVGKEALNQVVIQENESAKLNLSLFYKGHRDAKAYLNFISVSYLKKLSLNGNQINFRTLTDNTHSVSRLVIGNSTNDLILWDITDHINPKNIPLSFDGDKTVATTNTSVTREYIALKGNEFSPPVVIGKVENQNLHAIGTAEVPDMIIVTSEELLGSAKDLAQFRESNDQLRVAVVVADHIYNEFSSGSQDISAIRDFVKMVYERNNGKDSLKYLLLFGSASFDYKDRIKGNKNAVPVYQTKQSLHNVQSQSSDDFYGYLEDHEGAMESLTHKNMDIGIGRITVSNQKEAGEVLEKLKNYSTSSKTLGKWRNTVCLVADNADYKSNRPSLHMIDPEVFGPIIKSMNPNINLNKLYLDAYPLVSTPSGSGSPEMSKALLNQITSGALIVNYSGHGGPTLLAQENILNNTDIDQLKNIDRLPFFVTATCDFGVYDNPEVKSGAQKLILKPKGGAIGVLSSTRPVYQMNNKALNAAFYNEAFNFKKDSKPRIGDIIRLAKNKENRPENINYTLLGDPSMMLAYPEQEIILTHVNDSSVTVANATLKALFIN